MLQMRIPQTEVLWIGGPLSGEKSPRSLPGSVPDKQDTDSQMLLERRSNLIREKELSLQYSPIIFQSESLRGIGSGESVLLWLRIGETWWAVGMYI